jgi:cardiolipin synthase
MPPHRRLTAAWPICALVAACALFGCALPSSANSPPVPPAQTAGALTLHDARGSVPTQRKQSDLTDLTAVRAEGKGELLQLHLGVMAAQDDLHLYRGNSARLLIDGPQTFAAMKDAIAKARHRVLAEFYIVEDAGVAAELAAQLLDKAAQGVGVALLYDSVGSLQTPDAFFDRLRAGGIAVCAFNPLNPVERLGVWGLTERNHRKLLAVDSEVAFTGGLNLTQAYAEGSFGSARSTRSTATEADEDRGWRDTQVQVGGPVVAAMARLFDQSWIKQGCKGVLPSAPPALVAAPGERVIRLVAGDPAKGVNPSYSILISAVSAARRSVLLTMASFAPGHDMVEALAEAARRGVDVQIVLPGRSDVALVQLAARSYYERLLQAGVQIHEMQHAVMHAKTFVVDGVLSSVGSSNLDWRSIVGNNEMDLHVLGQDFGADMEALFQHDVSVSTRIDPAQWQRRGWWQKGLESLGRLMEPLL